MSRAVEKAHLAQTYNADVVDMEGYIALQFLSQFGIAVAMVRVVSDDCQHDLPDLSNAFDAAGSLQPFPLALAMLRRPIAAIQLIQGSWQGLTQLTNVASVILILKH
jgi:nucleoside phosphorylase